jgi:hypothetical protein
MLLTYLDDSSEQGLFLLAAVVIRDEAGSERLMLPRPASTPFHRDGASSVVGRPAYEMAYRSIDGQPEPIHA